MYFHLSVVHSHQFYCSHPLFSSGHCCFASFCESHCDAVFKSHHIVLAAIFFLILVAPCYFFDNLITHIVYLLLFYCLVSGLWVLCFLVYWCLIITFPAGCFLDVPRCSQSRCSKSLNLYCFFIYTATC